MKRCIFQYQDGCTALTVKKCDGCKFAKSESEYYAAQVKAKQRLDEMGLEPIIVGKGHDAILTTRKVEVNDNG